MLSARRFAECLFLGTNKLFAENKMKKHMA